MPGYAYYGLGMGKQQGKIKSYATSYNLNVGE
jgi:hypothetical protein